MIVLAFELFCRTFSAYQMAPTAALITPDAFCALSCGYTYTQIYTNAEVFLRKLSVLSSLLSSADADNNLDVDSREGEGKGMTC